MEHLLRSLVRKFGFKAVHEELEIVRGEYKVFYEEQLAFIRGERVVSESASATEQQTQTDLPTAVAEAVADPACQESADSPAVADADADTKQVLISESTAVKAAESEKGKEITIEAPKRKMKVIRKGSKTIQVPVKEQPEEVEVEEEQEVASATADPPANTFEEVSATAVAAAPSAEQPRRTAAEIKKWQRDQEANRRTYMKANKISRTSLMTVENVRKWLEDGHTYARIAREQLGCKEEDVSKFAKEHGLQRKKN